MNKKIKTNNIQAPREEWIKDIIDDLGGLDAVKNYLGVSQSAITQWKVKIPAESAVKLVVWAAERGLDLGLRDFFPHYYASHPELNKVDQKARFHS